MRIKTLMALPPFVLAAVLLGRRDEPLLQICARYVQVEGGQDEDQEQGGGLTTLALTKMYRQIVEAAGAAGYRKPILLGLGFKVHSMQVVREVCQAVATSNVWT